MHTDILKATFILLLVLLSPQCPAQNYRSQEGFSMGGGISSLGRFTGFLNMENEPGTSRFQAFSWEAGFFRIRSIDENVAFSQGISVFMLGYRFKRNRELWNPGSDSLVFESNRQILESYYISFPFRWSFYLNRHSAGRYFVGPGLALSFPVFQVAGIKGKDRNGQYHDIRDRRFPQNGPYAFLCPELETGWLYEFPDCSLARISLFCVLRAPGIFRDDDYYEIQRYAGFRFAWIFGNN
jgi:hypothetical protein